MILKTGEGVKLLKGVEHYPLCNRTINCSYV